MRRREFITLLGAAAGWPFAAAASSVSWPLAARAQQAGKVWRIGFLVGSTLATFESGMFNGFLQRMRELGYVERRDFVVEWRFAEGRYERFSEFAAEMVQLKVDVIVLATPAAVRSVQQATATIPIVMGYSTDPVGNGFVASLARPGGNTTGLASSLDDIVQKHLELLVEAVPNLSRVGLLTNPNSPNHGPVLKNALDSGTRAGVHIVPVEARNPQEIESSFAALVNERVGAVICVSDAVFFGGRQKLAERALRNRLPSIFSQREYVVAGGLMSYGESLFDFYRRAAVFVDKIFKGAKPTDLPVEQPTRFFLTVNLKTANALGLDLPPMLLARADEVIE
jgi:putative ABC transport system substrate-binding protein